MSRYAVTILLATLAVDFAAAGEASKTAPPAEEVQAETAEEAKPAVEEAFELLVREPPDPEQALSLIGRRAPDEDTGDIDWQLAHAFALARAGESTRAATELERLARLLRHDAGLDVRSYRFVTEVTAFGVYEEDGRQVLYPGDRLMAYAEVVGFECEPVPEAEEARATWRVSIKVEFTIENLLTGEKVTAWGPDAVEHATRSEIHDLHVTRVIGLPDDLAPGEYELKLEVRDALAEGVSGAGVRRLRVAGQ